MTTAPDAVSDLRIHGVPTFKDFLRAIAFMTFSQLWPLLLILVVLAVSYVGTPILKALSKKSFDDVAKDYWEGRKTA